ncbi:hypothetical protein PIB30_050206 [Stylosanthes scabra]|uniref:Uncharacterized protein n=1 Tax=Stylosanthes scabra TaxID=79078 RepID=A0ABU6VJ49_9FABA|nr:hypothetical protein [Stylosanthes scabra]
MDNYTLHFQGFRVCKGRGGIGPVSLGMGEALVVGGCRPSQAPVGHGTQPVHEYRWGGRHWLRMGDAVEGHGTGPWGGDAACPRGTGGGGGAVGVPGGTGAWFRL